MNKLVVALAAILVLAQLSTHTLAQPRSSTANLLSRADSIAQKVSKLRGLPIKRPIKRGVMTKAQIRARLLVRLNQEYTPKQIQAEELALKRLGLLPERTNYKNTVVKLLTDQIAGFYDPADRKLYIAGWSTSSFLNQADMLMAHEIDHALQDQTFDLDKFMKAVKNNSDASTARQALVEGDGTVLMIEYMLAPMGIDPWSNPKLNKLMGPQLQGAMSSHMGAMASTPLVLREGLMFPYLGGMKFVAHFRRNNTWARIDQIYRKPPLSTEHILHPEKYERYERPDTVAARPLPALRNYTVVHDNITGELGVSLFLRQHGLPIARAQRAAAGWGGDRTVTYAPKRHKGGVAGTIAVMATVWDSEAEAIDFMAALAHAVPKLSRGRRISSTNALIHYRRSESVVAKRTGDRVVLVVGGNHQTAPALAEQVLRRWTVRRN